MDKKLTNSILRTSRLAQLEAEKKKVQAELNQIEEGIWKAIEEFEKEFPDWKERMEAIEWEKAAKKMECEEDSDKQA